MKKQKKYIKLSPRVKTRLSLRQSLVFGLLVGGLSIGVYLFIFVLQELVPKDDAHAGSGYFSGSCYGNDIVELPNGELVLTGHAMYSGTYNSQVLYFNTLSDGEVNWAYTSGNLANFDVGYDAGSALAMGTNGSLGLAGSADGMFLAQIDYSGFGFCNRDSLPIMAVPLNVVTTSPQAVSFPMQINSNNLAITVSDISLPANTLCINNNNQATSVNNPPAKKEKKVKVYPNPAKGYVCLGLYAGIPDPDFRIYDLTGKMVYSRNGEHWPEGEIRIDLNTLSEGLYMFSLYSRDEVVTSGKLMLR